MSREELLRAVASNHRAWFRRGVRATDGRIEHVRGIELVVAEGHGMLPFPGPRSREGLDEVVERIRSLGLRNVGCWSLLADTRLGTSLVARGFGWGWQPHWMALDLSRLGDAAPEHVVTNACAPYAEGVPYEPRGNELARAMHLGIRRDGLTVGHIAVNPWRGIAGIYSMGVAPRYRGTGIGRALTIAACHMAAEGGCRYAVLNATEDGERVYRTVGFESLGWGQTWWFFRGQAPTARQTAIAEAIGTGAVGELAALSPSDRELVSPLPGGTSPLRLTVLTGQLEAARWLLDRLPRLAARRLDASGGTLLHVAVEYNRRDFIELALSHGVDPTVRDQNWNATALSWAEHFGNEAIVELLARSTGSATQG